MVSSIPSRLLRSFLPLVFLFVGLAASAQVDNVYVYGTVKDYTTSKKLDGVTVSVFKNGSKLTEVVSPASGKYEFNLDYGSEYKLVYAKPGMISKNITIDTRNIPEEERAGGHGMNIEMTLFNDIPGVDFSVLQQPIGKAKIDPATNEMAWDLQYTAQIKSEVDRLMREYDDKKKREAGADADFAKLMTQGEAAMTGADYKKAVDSFTGALALKAGDAKATARLSDAKMKLDELEGDKKKNEQYAALIKDADGLFGKKDYATAKGKYEQAADLKDTEAYPKQKMKECQAFIDDLARKAEEDKKAKEAEEKYQAAIAAADAAFKGEKWEDAKAKYTDASGMKPAEKYPKDQLTAIAAKLAELAKKAEDDKKNKETDAKYQAAIVAADAAFNAANYDQAKTKYNDAIAIKATEKYPKDQLAAIEQKLAELAKKAEDEKKAKDLDAQYQAAITAADAAFQKQTWDEAKTKYNEALGLKATEKYPKDQLAAIDKAIADAAKKDADDKKKKELDEQYQAAIAAADAAFQKQTWDEAKAKYNMAIGLKATEKYPKDQLAAIDKAIADAAKKDAEDKKQQEIDAKFNKLVEDAEALFTAEKYEASKSKFQEALTVKKDESHPKERIVEIDAKLAELARQADNERKRKEEQAKYDALIASADKNFDAKKYGDALNDYKDALAMRSEEQHPKDRITEIGSLLDADAKAKAEAERLAREKADLEKRYTDLIANGDKAFNAKNYADATSAYTDALGLKEGEKYPTDRLAEIKRLQDDLAAKSEADRLKAEQDAAEKARLDAERDAKAAADADVEARYKEAIAKADIAFGSEKFDAAREGYTEALAIKTGEKYPTDQLAAIEKLLADRLKAASDADRAAEEQRRLDEERKKKEAADAEAARLAAEDQKRSLEDAKARDERYAKIILDADHSMGDKDYAHARDLYTQALDVKAEEVYPQSKIEQIDKLLAEAERKQREADLAAQQVKEEPPPAKENISIDIRKEQEAEQFMRDARDREEAEKYERIKKLKSDVTDESTSNYSEASVRRDSALHANKEYTGTSDKIYEGSEAMRKKNEEELAAWKASLAERDEQVLAKATTDRGQAVAAKEAGVAAVEQRDATWKERHAGQVDGAVRSQQEVVQAMSDRTTAGEKRSVDARQAALQTNEQLAALQQRGNSQADRERAKVATQKELETSRQQQLVNRATDSRTSAKEQLDATPMNQPRAFADYNRSQLASQYPQGVTEESLTEGNKVIIRRVVVQGNKADEYSKVIAKWGTFYFKNGQSITEYVWSKDTEQ